MREMAASWKGLGTSLKTGSNGSVSANCNILGGIEVRWSDWLWVD